MNIEQVIILNSKLEQYERTLSGYGDNNYPTYYTEPVFVNLLRSPGIYSQPDGIDSWTPKTFTNTGSELKCHRHTEYNNEQHVLNEFFDDVNENLNCVMLNKIPYTHFVLFT
jgi:hypothetical protein